MRILFLHPEDSPYEGPWAATHWDLIVDLGFASSLTYEEWSRQTQAPVFSIYQFAGQSESFRWVNQFLQAGRGRLFERMGLDWWEILAVWSYQHLQLLYFFERLRPEIDDAAHELAASRPHLFTRIVDTALSPCKYFKLEGHNPVQNARRKLRSARRLRLAQMAEIAFDKWDSTYQLRRHLDRHKRARLTEPAVMMPSSYSNVTRTVLAYAAQLPHRQFLLAATRRSAWPIHLPSNVKAVPLAAYARAEIGRAS